ncbi:hypothetical protein BDW67DRAFT_124785 [Aspergillus spinulosporus]
MPIPTVCLGNGERCLGMAMHGRVHCGRHQVSDRLFKPRIFAKLVTIVSTSVSYSMSFPFPLPEYTHHSGFSMFHSIQVAGAMLLVSQIVTYFASLPWR